MTLHSSSSALDLSINLQLTALFIGVPTFLMGGTLPILTEGLVQKFDTSHKVHAWIYSINTLGAFVGSLLGGFLLIESLGLALTLFFTSLSNFMVAFFAFLLSRSPEMNFEGIAVQPEDPRALCRRRWILYGISFLSGFYVFTFESLFIRMASLSMGPSSYTYTIIVASFILAIAIGSFSVSLFKRIRGVQHLLFVQLAMGVSLFLTYFTIPLWPEWLLRIRILIQPSVMNLPFLWTLNTLMFVALLVIPVGLMGMQLPLIFSLLKDQKVHLAETVGKVYSINSLGSFFGALIGGYLAYQFLSAPQVFALGLALVLFSLSLIAKMFQSDLQAPWRYGSYAVTLILGAAVMLLPNWPMKNYSPSLFSGGAWATGKTSFQNVKDQMTQSSKSKFLFASYGPNSLVTVVDNPIWGRTLYINGKPDASEKIDSRVRSFNIVFPLIFTPKIEKIFIIGLGASRSLGIATLLKDVKKVDIVEMSEGVIASRKLFEDHALNVSQRENKFKIHKGDAYKIL
ncbi:MAG: hypothetical protein KDD22_06110, partial [Bdellovibrionales bacterium]|nr:hypothetical protein [Bdellovibrionales bacterium]